MDLFCESLLKFKVNENILWKTIKRTYWPCLDKSVEFAFVEADEDWDDTEY